MEEDFLSISAVEHYAYCPRQAALIHVEGVWADNSDTAVGTAAHQVVDRSARMVRRDGIETWLSLPVSSVRLGVSGVCDAVEFRPGPIPVEHKPVRTKHQRSAVTQQLAVQAMCLEEMFECTVEYGVIFAHREHRRQEIVIDQALRAVALRSLRAAQAMLTTEQLPSRVSDARCRNCSLRELCLVDERGQPFVDSGANQRFAAEGER